MSTKLREFKEQTKQENSLKEKESKSPPKEIIENKIHELVKTMVLGHFEMDKTLKEMVSILRK